MSIVLNALRHQRFGQIEAGDRAIPPVYGAQRLTASEVWAGEILADKPTDKEVLNALRHQRFGQNQCGLQS